MRVRHLHHYLCVCVSFSFRHGFCVFHACFWASYRNSFVGSSPWFMITTSMRFTAQREKTSSAPNRKRRSLCVRTNRPICGYFDRGSQILRGCELFEFFHLRFPVLSLLEIVLWLVELLLAIALCCFRWQWSHRHIPKKVQKSADLNFFTTEITEHTEKKLSPKSTNSFL